MNYNPIIRILALTLVIVLAFGLTACGSAEAKPTEAAVMEAFPESGVVTAENDNVAAEEFPIVGTWKGADADVYLRIQKNGEIKLESVSKSSSTHTVNGVTTTSSSSQVLAMGTASWSIQNNVFMYNNMAPYEMVKEGDTYKLTTDKTTYIRVGDLDYTILMDTENAGENGSDPSELPATPYQIGEELIAEGVELVLTEKGVAEDLRITSRDSGIKITSGPSASSDKKYVYLKGTLKNTTKGTVWPAIAGDANFDGYSYKVRVEVINEDATPASQIEPLDSMILLIYAHVPNELAESFTEGELIFGFNNNLTDVNLSDCDYRYRVDMAN